MGRRYTSIGDQSLSTSVSTDLVALELTSASTVKPRVYDLLWGNVGTAADDAIVYRVQRHTASGTGTAATEQPLDPDDPAALASAKSNMTVDGTLTANLFLLSMGVNARASYRWVAAPGAEWILPATAGNGVSFLAYHASAVTNWECTMAWEE